MKAVFFPRRLMADQRVPLSLPQCTMIMKEMNSCICCHQSSNRARGIAPVPFLSDLCSALPSIHNSCDVSWLLDGDTEMLSAVQRWVFVFVWELHINECRQEGKSYRLYLRCNWCRLGSERHERWTELIHAVFCYMYPRVCDSRYVFTAVEGGLSEKIGWLRRGELIKVYECLSVSHDSKLVCVRLLSDLSPQAQCLHRPPRLLHTYTNIYTLLNPVHKSSQGATGQAEETSQRPRISL